MIVNESNEKGYWERMAEGEMHLMDTDARMAVASQQNVPESLLPDDLDARMAFASQENFPVNLLSDVPEERKVSR